MERRSDFIQRRKYHWRLGQDHGAARGPYNVDRNAECDALAAEAAGVVWAPEAGEVEQVVAFLTHKIERHSGINLRDDIIGWLAQISAGEHRR